MILFVLKYKKIYVYICIEYYFKTRIGQWNGGDCGSIFFFHCMSFRLDFVPSQGIVILSHVLKKWEKQENVIPNAWMNEKTNEQIKLTC